MHIYYHSNGHGKSCSLDDFRKMRENLACLIFSCKKTNKLPLSLKGSADTKTLQAWLPARTDFITPDTNLAFLIVSLLNPGLPQHYYTVVQHLKRNCENFVLANQKMYKDG